MTASPCRSRDVSPDLRERARQLHKDATGPERELGQLLKSQQFVDFVCLSARLVVDLDGDSHAGQVAYDQHRDEAMRKQGLSVLRLSNRDFPKNNTGAIENNLLACPVRAPQPDQGANHD